MSANNQTNLTAQAKLDAKHDATEIKSHLHTAPFGAHAHTDATYKPTYQQQTFTPTIPGDKDAHALAQNQSANENAQRQGHINPGVNNYQQAHQLGEHTHAQATGYQAPGAHANAGYQAPG